MARSCGRYDLGAGRARRKSNDPTVSYLVDAQRASVEIESMKRDRQISILGAAYQDGESPVVVGYGSGGIRSRILARSPVEPLQGVTLDQVGVRLYRSDIFAATDNTVILPRYFRADAAVYFNIHSRFGAQVNLENLFDEDYHLFANGNNNITPGSPRALRVGLTTRF
jgi:catecholate siderophore receptor